MLRCKVCGSGIARTKRYDRHLATRGLHSSLESTLELLGIGMAHLTSVFRGTAREWMLFRGDVRICGSCGHGEMVHPPTEEALLKYYKERYWRQKQSVFGEASFGRNGRWKNLRAVHQIEFVAQTIGKGEIGTILEIGAGSASVSLLFKERLASPAAKIHVCEPSRQWDELYTREGIEKIGDFFPCATSLSFEYIHASHWLEHVRDLDQTVSALCRILEPSGFLFLEVPNTEHFYWDLPERDTPHIQFFTRRSLVDAFKKHGFESIHIGEYGITIPEQRSCVRITEDRYGACDKGCWVRALFRKIR